MSVLLSVLFILSLLFETILLILLILGKLRHSYENKFSSVCVELYYPSHHRTRLWVTWFAFSLWNEKFPQNLSLFRLPPWEQSISDVWDYSAKSISLLFLFGDLYVLCPWHIYFTHVFWYEKGIYWVASFF